MVTLAGLSTSHAGTRGRWKSCWIIGCFVDAFAWKRGPGPVISIALALMDVQHGMCKWSIFWRAPKSPMSCVLQEIYTIYAPQVKLFDFGGMDKRHLPFREVEPEEGNVVVSLSYSSTGHAFLACTAGSQPKVCICDTFLIVVSVNRSRQESNPACPDQPRFLVHPDV